MKQIGPNSTGTEKCLIPIQTQHWARKKSSEKTPVKNFSREPLDEIVVVIVQIDILVFLLNKITKLCYKCHTMKWNFEKYILFKKLNRKLQLQFKKIATISHG